MVRFQCDGKRKKNVIFLVFEWKILIFSQKFRRPLPKCYISKVKRLITSRLCNEGLLISFLIYGKSMVRVFWVKTWNFYENIFKKLQT